MSTLSHTPPSPAVHHDGIHCSWTTRGRRLAVTFLQQFNNLHHQQKTWANMAYITCTFIHIYKYINEIHLYIYIYTYIYIHTNTHGIRYVCTYIYIYMYI